MKKRDILISLAVIGASIVAVWTCLQMKGQVRIDAGGADAQLQLKDGWLRLTTLTSRPDAAELHARLYNARRLNVSAQQDGQTWRIESLGPWGELSRIRIRRNETTTLRLGPPFFVKAQVSQTGSVLSIGYSIVGQAGEHYRSFASQDGRAMPGAKINIVDEAGNVLETGQFSYG